jgi:hypothetical protein
MACNDAFLDISIINPELHRRYFQYPSSKGQILEFNDIAEWRDHLYTFRIRSHRVPVVYADQFHVALKLLLFAWADGHVIKAGELAALSALEGSLREAYFQQIHLTAGKKRQTLANYLDYMVEHDGLSAAYRSGKSEEKPNALNVIRNGIAHGYPFSNMPWGGLMEAVRDIIEHAFRNHPERSEPLEQSGELLLEEGFAELDVC